MRTPRLWTSAIALALVAMAPMACGKKKDKKSSSPSEPQAVETFVVGSSSDGRSMTIQYRSNVKGAKFKCATDVDGQAGAWTECPSEGATVPTEAGKKYVFKVKAISPDGTEDQEPDTYSFAGAGAQPTNPGESDGDEPGADNVSAVILNKADVGQIYTKKNLKLSLGVEGADERDVRLECMRENQRAFSLCGSNAEYDGFGELIDGSTYSLTVRPVMRDGGAAGREDTITFTVKIDQLSIEGEADLLANKRGARSLTFEASRRAGLKIECAIDEAQAMDCSTGISIELDRMQPGSHALKISARNAQGQIAGEKTLNFCAIECSTSGGVARAPLVKSLQIGSFYEYVIPEDMHVIEYVTTKTVNDTLSFFRVISGTGPNEDPLYLGNYACTRDYDRRVSASSPSGAVWDYCHSMPTRDRFKWLTDFRLANNHLEVATDFTGVDQYNHDRVMINVFDRDYEYMYKRGRFEQLCLNKRGAIYRTKPIRFIDRGFWGENVKAEFYMCVAELVGVGPGLPSANDEWWIGGFFLSSDGLDLPKHECYGNNWAPKYDATTAYHDTIYEGYYDHIAPDFCGEFHNPSLLEVVVMTKAPIREPHDFARYAQDLFLKNLREISPLSR